jgi:hypothetical protein
MNRAMVCRRRCAAVLAALALALASVAAQAYSVPRYQAPWPGLANSGSYTPACDRVTFANNVTAEPTNASLLWHTLCVAPNYAVSNVRVMVANFYVTGAGTNNPELCPGNTQHVDFATIFISGVAYPVTFGGALGVNIDNCGFVWSDPLRDASGNLVTIAANASYYIRISKTVAANAKHVLGEIASVSPTFSNQFSGDGFEGTTTQQTAKRTSGTVANSNGNGNFGGGPALIVGQGWDGSAVYGLVGASLDYGYLDWDLRAPYVSGAMMRALADVSSGPRNMLMLAVPGTKPEDQSSIAAGQQQLRLRALRSIGNIPFNQILSGMGQNSPTIAGTSLAAYQAVMGSWWRFWHANCPACTIFQTTFPAHPGNLNNAKWTTQADQTSDYPSGTRWAADAWMAANAGLPSYVKGIDLTTPFTTGSGFADNPGNWPTTGFSGALATAISTATKSIVVAATTAPQIGDFIVLEPGTSNVEIIPVVNVTGSASPWAIALSANTAKTHALNAAVGTALTYEGSHAATQLYQAAANALIALKRSGALP